MNNSIVMQLLPTVFTLKASYFCFCNNPNIELKSLYPIQYILINPKMCIHNLFQYRLFLEPIQSALYCVLDLELKIPLLLDKYTGGFITARTIWIIRKNNLRKKCTKWSTKKLLLAVMNWRYSIAVSYPLSTVAILFRVLIFIMGHL